MSRVYEVGHAGGWTPSVTENSEESAWQAWLAKGRARDQRGYARRIQALRWVLVAVLLAVAGSWAQPAPYEMAFRFFVMGAAFVLMIHAFRARSYVFAALLGAIMWLYNPLAPVFSLTGDWQRALVAATTLPLFLSIRWEWPRRTQQ